MAEDARSGASRLPPDQYRLLVEHHPTMIWRAGLDSKCDYFNDTWLGFTGRSLGQEVGDGWAAGVHQEDLDACVRTYLEHFHRRQSFEMEYRLRRYDGVYRYIFDRGVPFWNDAGEFAGFIGSCVDIHDRHEADRAKSTFLAMVAHELRTPLTSMNALLEVARRKAARGELVDESAFKRLKTQNEKFAALVREIGDTAHLEEGHRLSFHPEELELAELVQDVARHFREGLAGRARTQPLHTLEVSVRRQAFSLAGDRRRLEQLLLNLLDNAVKFSPAGGAIRIGLDTEGAMHVLAVSDPGIGIPAADIPSLTRRYYRGSNASPEHYPGFGLGLAIVREITELHGGELRFSSPDGAGTTVTVRLAARSAHLA